MRGNKKTLDYKIVKRVVKIDIIDKERRDEVTVLRIRSR